MNSAILTLEELAEYLKLPAATLQQEADRGQLPGRKIGENWRFLRAAIDDWLRADAPQAHDHHGHDHLDENRPIVFPKSAGFDRTPIPKQGNWPDAERSDNPWSRFLGIDEDDPEVAAIAAELRAESTDF
jgi:excisionase family DNA binding protein